MTIEQLKKALEIKEGLEKDTTKVFCGMWWTVTEEQKERIKKILCE